MRPSRWPRSTGRSYSTALPSASTRRTSTRVLAPRDELRQRPGPGRLAGADGRARRDRPRGAAGQGRRYGWPSPCLAQRQTSRASRGSRTCRWVPSTARPGASTPGSATWWRIRKSSICPRPACTCPRGTWAWSSRRAWRWWRPATSSRMRSPFGRISGCTRCTRIMTPPSRWFHPPAAHSRPLGCTVPWPGCEARRTCPSWPAGCAWTSGAATTARPRRPCAARRCTA